MEGTVNLTSEVASTSGLVGRHGKGKHMKQGLQRRLRFEERTECILYPESEYQTQDLHAGNEKPQLMKEKNEDKSTPLITRAKKENSLSPP